MAWTKQRLEEVVRTRLQGTRLVVVANREPFIHLYHGEEIRCLRPASGLTTALDPVMRAAGGVWVAHGSGDADPAVADARGRLLVPPDDPHYALKRVWLTREEEEGYYYGFSNETLWPLCHQAYCRPTFDPADWEQYRTVNRKFADAVLEEVGDEPALVFVQDYHFTLLPRMLKEARPDLVVAQFWHIPWPNREVFRICPWADEILDGLLGNDLLSFHIQYHCNNFLETVDRCLESRVEPDRFAVTRHGHTTLVRPHPISVDPDLPANLLGDDWQVEARRVRGKYGLGNRRLLIGVDRVDYIKGIPERLRAVDRLLDSRPDLRGTFHFVQVGTPSRGSLPAYQRLNAEVEGLVAAINAKHGDDLWRPIVWINEHWGSRQVYLLYRMAAGCVVSSLHDGMNLVAKEFVSTRDDEQGVLVLSRFTGAARELTDAVLINPYDVEELARALGEALTMPADEQAERMRRMRGQVLDHNIYRWAGMLLSEASRLVRPPSERPVGPPHANGFVRLVQGVG